jgi:hypothetical protein
VELQALPSRIGQVRRIVSAQLRYWHLDSLTDRAELGVTELLSNVHRHARPDKTCTVEIELRLDRLTVSVRDHDPRLPVLGDAQPLATCGRGLAMVAAVSESWGVRPDGDSGKVVWFTLPALTQAAAGTAPLAVSAPVPDAVPVSVAEADPAPEPAAEPPLAPVVVSAVEPVPGERGTRRAPARSAVPG